MTSAVLLICSIGWTLVAFGTVRTEVMSQLILFAIPFVLLTIAIFDPTWLENIESGGSSALREGKADYGRYNSKKVDRLAEQHSFV